MNFDSVDDPDLEFVNGGFFVQRSKEWLNEYKQWIEERIGPLSYTPWTYGWFRTLDDGGHALYGEACRALNVCPKCFKEWGQPYFANHCKCFVLDMERAIEKYEKTK